MVRAAIRRETGEMNGVGVDVPHRHRVPLGLVLLAQGWITHPQLQAALEAQKQTGQGRIGDWLVQSCGLAEERVTRGLGVQWSCPVLAMNGFSPSAMALVMPKRFIWRSLGWFRCGWRVRGCCTWRLRIGRTPRPLWGWSR